MEHIHLFFALNDNYCPHCCTTMVSILENNGNLFFEFYLLSDYISPENRQKLDCLNQQYDHFQIHYVKVDNTIFKQFDLNIQYITPQTYYRYAIAEWFPQLDKALYLDCDLIVKGSLEELWHTDISDYLCAGVPDLWIENIYYKPEIKLQPHECYINAGVLLLNLKKMRAEHTYQTLCQTTEQPPCKIGIVDIKKVVANSSEAKSIQTEQKKKIDELTRFIEKARLSVDKEKDPKKQKELEEKFTKELNEKRTAIDSEYTKKLSLAEQDIRNIIETTAKDKGYSMVIMKSVVLYGGEDITDEVAKAVK